MLLQHLEQMRGKTTAVRKRYALVYSLGITGTIVMVWLTVLFAGTIDTNDERAASPGYSLFGEAEDTEQQNVQTYGDLFKAANTFLDGAPAKRQPVSAPSSFGDYRANFDGEEVGVPSTYTIGSETSATGTMSIEQDAARVPLGAPPSMVPDTSSTTEEQQGGFVEDILREYEEE